MLIEMSRSIILGGLICLRPNYVCVSWMSFYGYSEIDFSKMAPNLVLIFNTIQTPEMACVDTDKKRFGIKTFLGNNYFTTHSIWEKEDSVLSKEAQYTENIIFKVNKTIYTPETRTKNQWYNNMPRLFVFTAMNIYFISWKWHHIEERKYYKNDVFAKNIDKKFKIQNDTAVLR